jgi:hypothetical protein
MIHPGELHDRGPRATDHLPFRVVKAFALHHERHEPHDLVLLLWADAKPLVASGVLKRLGHDPRPLEGYRQCIAL